MTKAHDILKAYREYNIWTDLAELSGLLGLTPPKANEEKEL